MSFLPGLVFGVVFGILLRCLRQLSTTHALLWGFMTTVGYVAAFFAGVVALLSTPAVLAENYWLMNMVGGMAGGLVGSAITAIAIYNRLRPNSMLPLLATGTLMGALFAVPPYYSQYESIDFIAFYALWQGVFAAVLAWRLRDPMPAVPQAAAPST